MICRSDYSGLGNQTRDLCRLLKPDKILLIDSFSFNGKEQHPEWYSSYDVQTTHGFAMDDDVERFLSNVDAVLTAETFYNNAFIRIAQSRGIRTYNQYNYEFFEPLANRRMMLPTKILSPSHWHYDEMVRLTSRDKMIYLPPPTFIDDFNDIRETNLKRTGKRRFLHVAGTMAAFDRAGTKDLLAALEFAKENFELVIRVQKGEQLKSNDPRVTFDYTQVTDEKELYRDFDAMIQPRKYGGLNLPMNEALAAGLPVIMTDISPNNKILPRHWLVPTHNTGNFQARVRIDLWSAYPQELGFKLDWLSICSLDIEKQNAYNIAKANYSPEVLLPRYREILT